MHICFGGPVVRLMVNSRFHTFEMHHYFGPIKLKADGETPAENYWREDSDFWPVFDSWVSNGQKIDEYGRGV